MSTVKKSIDVDVPVRTAYNQWTQFEEFPRFMEGVREVRQIDDRRLHWRANIAGNDEEWEAEITEQTPDKHIMWVSTSGARNVGKVTFEALETNQTRVTLEVEYVPDNVVKTVGDVLGFVSRRVEGDLERFKEFVEARGTETGAWRGEIHGREVQATPEHTTE